MMRILIICTANICRSPMAEHLFKAVFKNCQVTVDSAGIHGQYGLSADGVIKKMLVAQGLDSIRHHQSKPLTSSMSGQYDLYLCMENHHLDALQKMIPSVTGRAYLYGYWENEEILDPHARSEEHYLLALQKITKATQDWFDKLPQLGML